MQFCWIVTAQVTPAPVVDLGYARYQGYYNQKYDQNIYLGYAAPPVGELRWQRPQEPAANTVEDMESGAPQLVVIQYRLGAFGFLSSAELARLGVPNAGIHDMYASLQWVQKFIERFGGDPNQVTIAGESAGAGAAMLLGLAHGGRDGSSLFKGIIAASPYLPAQWNYDDSQPSESYYRFADRAGCLTDEIAAKGSVFGCLVSADTAVLKSASDYVSTTGRYGHWAFTPVTDGVLIQERPSNRLLTGGEINGLHIISSNNLNEGPFFVPQNITDRLAFKIWLLNNYPLLSEQNITKILDVYAVPENACYIPVDTNGLDAPFSTTNSQFATGWQQAAFNLYAEATFVCPSYWIADAYARKEGHKAWHFQYSVAPGLHGDDISPMIAMPDEPGIGTNEVFRRAFQYVWGNFIVNGDPTLSSLQFSAVGGGDVAAAGKETWPQWEGQFTPMPLQLLVSQLPQGEPRDPNLIVRLLRDAQLVCKNGWL
ncbi:hypothetical protein DL768_001610 [Monosporascus sp. mg162]|nr:hypothetical protein DL768_001610 [Monosporascus sp. mg162]